MDEGFPARLVKQGLLQLGPAARMAHRRAYPEQYAIGQPVLGKRQLDRIGDLISQVGNARGGADPARSQARGRRRRTDSNRQIPADTDTLRLSTSPCIGIFTSRSQDSRVSRRMPSPSAPSTQAIDSGRSAS